MKRSPLKRRAPLQAKAPMKRRADPSAQSNAQNAQKGRRKVQKAAQKDCRWRSPDYLAWVRSLPCCVCGATTGVAAHHIIGMWHLSGASLKAPDSYTMPACDPIYGHTRDCHQQIHAHKALRDQQPAWIKQTIRAALQAGVSAEAREELSHALAFVEIREG